MATKLDLKYNNTLITSLTPENNETTILTGGKYCTKDISANMNIDWYEGEVILPIDFTISSVAYKTPNGYTWAQWVDSDFNTDGWKNVDGDIMDSTESLTVQSVTAADTILAQAYTARHSG